MGSVLDEIKAGKCTIYAQWYRIDFIQGPRADIISSLFVLGRPSSRSSVIPLQDTWYITSMYSVFRYDYLPVLFNHVSGLLCPQLVTFSIGSYGWKHAFGCILGSLRWLSFVSSFPSFPIAFGPALEGSVLFSLHSDPSIDSPFT